MNDGGENVTVLYIPGEAKAAWRITVDHLEKYFRFKKIFTVEDLNLYKKKGLRIF